MISDVVWVPWEIATKGAYYGCTYPVSTLTNWTPPGVQSSYTIYPPQKKQTRHTTTNNSKKIHNREHI